jgi:hypothetical protein
MVRWTDVHRQAEGPARIYSSSQDAWMMLCCAAALFAVILMLLDWFRGGVEVPLPTLLLVLALVFLLRAARPGVELTAEGVVIRRLGKTFIPWREVADVGVRRVAGMRQAQIVQRDGRVRNLPAPCDSWPLRETNFDAKLKAIQTALRQAARPGEECPPAR